MLRHEEEHADRHRDHQHGDAEERQRERAGVLLERDRDEREQHEADEIGDRPDHAIGGAADPGRKDFRRQRRARAPEAEEAETPSEAERPQPDAILGIDPERHEDRAFDQGHDEGAAAADIEIAQSYRFGIYQLVVANWSRPPSARNGMETTLQVDLVPTGDVVSVTLIQGSGSSAFDRSAEAAVRKARRFEVPVESALFEKYFRRFILLFKPEDLLR